MNNPVIDLYQNCKEEDRLSTNQARRVEFIITQRILNDVFPKRGKVLDCAAGTGIYAFDLAAKGYDVTALDLTPRHVEYMRDMLKNMEFNMTIDVNDATDLSRFADETFDIVLCMGPIYHLITSELRMKCLQECKRVLVKGELK
jgi:2-polyprenyl-3-methyl-5-hydroxy-6-metoxy-1,4-benzoquinol methylase